MRVVAILNGDDHDALWAHLFPEGQKRQTVTLTSNIENAELLLRHRPRRDASDGVGTPSCILLCLDGGCPKDIAGKVRGIRATLSYPMTPIIVISRLVDPAVEVHSFRELLAFDFFPFPPTPSLVKLRIDEAAKFYDRTRILHLMLREANKDPTSFSAARLHDDVWARPHRVAVIGSHGDVLSSVLSQVKNCDFQFVRRGSEVQERLDSMPDAVIVAPDALDKDALFFAHWGDVNNVPVVGISDTYRLESIIRHRLSGYCDVIVDSLHPEIMLERIKMHILLGSLQSMARQRWAEYSEKDRAKRK